MNVVDLVFGNEAELEALGAAESLAAGRIVPEGAAAREAGVDFLLQFVQVVTVTLGADGSLTVRRDKERFVTPALEVPVEDTTGAGDLFTAGFLWALLHGAPLPICAAQGSAMAAEIVQVVGTTLDDASWRRLREGSYGYQPPQAQASAPAALASAPSIGTLIGLVRPPEPPTWGAARRQGAWQTPPSLSLFLLFWVFELCQAAPSLDPQIDPRACPAPSPAPYPAGPLRLRPPQAPPRGLRQHRHAPRGARVPQRRERRLARAAPSAPLAARVGPALRSALCAPCGVWRGRGPSFGGLFGSTVPAA